jgi:hypothetical protein
MGLRSYIDEDWDSFSRRWHRKRKTKNAINYVPYLAPLPPEPDSYADYKEYSKSRAVRKIKRLNSYRIIGWCCEHAEMNRPTWLKSVPFDDLKLLETLSNYYCFDLPNMETFLLKREPYMKSIRGKWFSESGHNLRVLGDQENLKGLIQSLSIAYKGIEELFGNPIYQPQYAASLRVLAAVLEDEADLYLKNTDDPVCGWGSYRDFLDRKNPNFDYPQTFINYSPLVTIYSDDEE